MRSPIRIQGIGRGERAAAFLGVQQRDRERGQVLILFAMMLVVILGSTAIVVDLGMLRNDRQRLVNALDAGALAGGSLLPVDGSVAGATANVQQTVTTTVALNYPGLAAPTITYKCLIGADPTTGLPLISRDIPGSCDPHLSLGHAPVASDFIGAGRTRASSCNPSAGDRCNTIQVAGEATTPYVFGPAIGIMNGSTGVAQTAACNGPCGAPPTAPVDLVVIIDRTASMSDADVVATKDAAKAIVSAYDPNLQRLALGLTGPSSTSSTCGTPATYGNQLNPGTLTAPSIGGSSTSYVQSAANSSSGAATLVISKPTSTATGNLLVAGITVDGGNGATITPPAGWILIKRTDNSTNVGIATYYRVAGSSEPASYSWGLSPSERASGAILRYTGVDTANPIDVSGGSFGAGTSVTAPTVTTTTAQTALVGFYGTDTLTTFSPPSGSPTFTERADIANSNVSGPSTEAATATETSAGATGSKSATAGASAAWVAQLVALRPVPVETYGTAIPANLSNWLPVGLTGVGAPAPGFNEQYSIGGVPNTNSHIVAAINCFNHPGGTGTNLATPMAMATYYLQTYGRPGVKWGILLETDGQPNYSSTGDPGNYTCLESYNQALNAKNANIEVYTVGFGLDGSNNALCPDGSGAFNGRRATYLLASMATQPSPDNLCTAAENTDGDHFFCEPKTSDLTAVFTAIATDFVGKGAHLVSLYPPPIVTSISPASGPKTGGTSVTINGQYLTGATKVTFGGATATGVTVVSDTKITATAPAGAPATVDVRVTTSGGTSGTVTGDRFTYVP